MDKLQTLTPKQYQVYKLICNGYAGCQIAYEQFIKQIADGQIDDPVDVASKFLEGRA